MALCRPETMLGDTAVAVHPEDERYRHLVGKQIRLPLTDRSIPIIADDYVDPEFGTGCLGITLLHDFNDHEVGLRHEMQPINVLDPSAAIDLPDSPYHGLDRYAARERIVADLQALDLVERIDDHTLMVPRGDRSGAVVEPYLTDQWFEQGPLAAPAIKAVEDGRIRFVPENWAAPTLSGCETSRTVNYSRQIWWGHRIPAWYDEEEEIYLWARCRRSTEKRLTASR